METSGLGDPVMRRVALGLIGGGLILAWVAQCTPAEAATLRIIQAVPTVQGQREAGPYDPGPLARVDRAPPARVLHVLEVDGAPPNGCARPAFEVVSGPRSGRGCFGSR